MTQEALARAAGIGRVTLVRIEKGEQIARFKTLSAIAQAVGRPVVDLYLDPEALDLSTNVSQLVTEYSTQNHLGNIELAAWSENLKRHSAELAGLDATSNEVFHGIKHVIDGFEALLTDPKNEPEVALVKEGLHLAARIFKGIRAAKVIGEMGYYETSNAIGALVPRTSLGGIRLAPKRINQTNTAEWRPIQLFKYGHGKPGRRSIP